MDRGLALIATLVVGGLIAAQPPANALFGRLVGDLGAAFASLVLSTAIVGVVLLAFGDPSQLKGLRGLQPVHLVGGVGGAAIVAVTLFTVRELGAGGVAAALVAMQLLVAAVLDHFGWLGLPKAEIGLQGVAAMVLLLAGTALMVTR